MIHFYTSQSHKKPYQISNRYDRMIQQVIPLFMRLLQRLFVCTTLLMAGCEVVEKSIYPVGALTVNIAWPDGVTLQQTKSLVFTISGEGISSTTQHFPANKASITVENIATGNKEVELIALDHQDNKKYSGKSSVHIEKDRHVTVVLLLKAIATDSTLPTVTLSVDTASILEAGGIIAVTATLSVVSNIDVIVTLTRSGTAMEGTDYILADAIVVPAGSLSASVTLTVLDDIVVEPNETVVIDMACDVACQESGVQQQIVTIIDNDHSSTVMPSVTLSIGTESIPEVGGVTPVTATLSTLSHFDVIVNLTKSGIATDNLDYILADAIVVPAGSLSASITLTVLDDFFSEWDEVVVINISTLQNGVKNGEQQQTVTIINDDPLPLVTLLFGTADISEIGESTSGMLILSSVSDRDVTVTLTKSGTATDGIDYTLADLIVIPAGSLSASITLTALADTIVEGNETVEIDISTILYGIEDGKQRHIVTIFE